MVEFFDNYKEASKWAIMHKGELAIFPSDDYMNFMYMERQIFDEKLASSCPYAVHYMLGFEWEDWEDDDE